MLESVRDRPNNMESQPQPQPDRTFIHTDHKVELHREEALLSGVLHGVLAHCSRNTSAPGVRRGHVSAICNVSATAAFIGVQIVGSNQASPVFSDEHFVTRGKPVR